MKYNEWIRQKKEKINNISICEWRGNNNIIKSNEIICPTCNEFCKYDIKNHRIKLYGRKNGHMIDNIKFEEFSNKQNIDLSEIKWDKCDIIS